MNFFLLPSDIQREIRDYLNIQDIISTYEAYRIEPPQKLVTDIAISRYFPETRSLHELLPFEEMDIIERVTSCIMSYNISSFVRLIKEIDDDNLTDFTCIENSIWKKRSRVCYYYMQERFDREAYDKYSIAYVIFSRSTEILCKYLDTHQDKIPSIWISLIKDMEGSYIYEFFVVLIEYSFYKLCEYLIRLIFDTACVSEDIFVQIIETGAKNGITGKDIVSVYGKVTNSTLEKVTPLLESESLVDICLSKGLIETAYITAKRLNIDWWKYKDSPYLANLLTFYVKDGLVEEKEINNKLKELGCIFKIVRVGYVLCKVITTQPSFQKYLPHHIVDASWNSTDQYQKLGRGIRSTSMSCICGKKNNLKLCKGCHRIMYCSDECEIVDWPSHKTVCDNRRGIY